MGQQGPSGGTGGRPFGYSSNAFHMDLIVVTHGAYINTLEVHWSDGAVMKWGNKTGPNLDTFNLDAEDWLQSISGQIGNLDGDGGPYVATISFVSGAGKNSPVWGGVAPGRSGGFFGGPGSSFDNLSDYSYTGAPIIGFFGRSGDYIDQIGIITG